MYGRYGRFPQLPFWAKVGEIPTSYKVAMSYEEQLLWLCHQIELIKSSSGNIDYNALENKPIINGVTLQGMLTLDNLDIQRKLRAGNGIIIDGNVISATGGGGGTGTDNYESLSHKPSINGVTLIGDKSFADLGLPTTKHYTELDNYVLGYYFDIAGNNVFVGEQIPRPNEDTNSCYLVVDLSEYVSNKYRITGDSYTQVWFTCTDNPLMEGSLLTSSDGSASQEEPWHLRNSEITVNTPENARYIVFSFNNTDNVSPKVEVITESIGGVTDYEDLNNKPQINGVTLIGNKSWSDLGLTTTTHYTELDNYVDDYYFSDFLEGNIFIGDEIPSPEAFINTKYIVLSVDDLPSTNFRVTGSSSTQIWFTCTDNPTLNTSILCSVGPVGTVGSPVHYQDTEVSINLPANANYIVFNFTETDEYTPKVEVISESYEGVTVTDLTENLVLSTSAISLNTGFYNTSDYKIYFNSASLGNEFVGTDQIVYIDNDKQTIWSPFELAYFDELQSLWLREQNEYIENTLTDSRGKIPTSKAVYDAIQNIEPTGSNFYTELDSSITLNADGTTTPELQTGYYFLKSPRSISYYDYDGNLQTVYQFNNGIFYYDSTEKDLKRTGINDENTNEIEYRLHHFTSNNGFWELSTVDENNFVKNLTGNSSFLQTSISDTGNNNDVANINAVRSYVSAKISRYADLEISQDTNFTTTADWKAETVPLELITNNIQDLISYNNSTHTFTALKSCKLKVELNSGLNFTTGTQNTNYFAVLRIAITSGGNTSYIGSSINLVSSVANNNSLINTIQLNAGDTFTYEIQVGIAGTYRIIGGRTYVIFTEMN